MNEMIVNEFRGFKIRTHFKENSDVWFVAKDIMEAIGLKNTSMALKKLKNIERDITAVADTTGRKQEMSIVNESGMYALIFQSRRKEAEDFRYWITNEVLPSIRKTGSYSILPVKEIDPLDQLRMHVTIMEKQREEIRKLNQSLNVVAQEAKQMNDSLTHDQATQLDSEMLQKFKETGIKNYKVLGHIKKQVKEYFFDNPASFTFKEIPRSGFEKAREIVRNFEVPERLRHSIDTDH